MKDRKFVIAGALVLVLGIVVLVYAFGGGSSDSRQPPVRSAPGSDLDDSGAVDPVRRSTGGGPDARSGRLAADDASDGSDADGIAEDEEAKTKKKSNKKRRNKKRGDRGEEEEVDEDQGKVPLRKARGVPIGG